MAIPQKKKEETQKIASSSSIQVYALPALAIACILLLGVSGYFYLQIRAMSSDAHSGTSRETEDLIAKVGRHIVLPEGETPTIATVSDPEKLRNQAFFAHAKSGDKVLLYAHAKKAFLYDPLADRLVEVAPINLGLQTE